MPCNTPTDESNHMGLLEVLIYMKISIGADPGVFLPTGSEDRVVLGVGNIPVGILPSCQNMKIIA